MKKVSGSSKPSKEVEKNSRLITSMVTTDKSLSYGVMSNLIADTITNKSPMTKLSALPQIKTRTEKLLQEENAKRERKLNQEESKSSSGAGTKGGGSTGGFFSGDNDGSREGRKAERERRREEHYKNNDVKERTPEEIAEMERQRRVRMAEEAEKWNFAPEDVPPEGDITEEEPVDYSTYVEEDVDVEDLDSGSSGDGEDDDVLDLD